MIALPPTLIEEREGSQEDPGHMLTHIEERGRSQGILATCSTAGTLSSGPRIPLDAAIGHGGGRSEQ